MSKPIFAASNFEGSTRSCRRVGDALTLCGTESPIEALLYEALNRIPWPAGVEIKRQFMIGRYRVDFMLGRRLPDGKADCLVVIECDGRNFHGIGQDYRRDRFLQIHGAAVLRFTGAELQEVDDVVNCAGEVLEWMDAAIRGADR